MLIPVNNVVQYGSIIATTYYDNERLCLIEGNKSSRILPKLDNLACILESNNIATVVGRDKRYYIVSFGDRYLYRLDRKSLVRYRVSNLSSKGKLIDTNLPDLGTLFPDKQIDYLYGIEEYQKSSIGVAKKFYAMYNGRKCVVKFSKYSDKELVYEQLYYKIGSLLGVPVCKCSCSIYRGRKCSISVVEYDSDDVFMSIKSLGGNLSQIYGRLDKRECRRLDSALLLDYIMLQQDRHMSNIALVNKKFYPLFDNGECLGLGPIGFFSSNFRKYTESLNKEYRHDLIKWDIQGCNQEFNSIGLKQENSMFIQEVRRIW